MFIKKTLVYIFVVYYLLYYCVCVYIQKYIKQVYLLLFAKFITYYNRLVLIDLIVSEYYFIFVSILPKRVTIGENRIYSLVLINLIYFGAHFCAVMHFVCYVRRVRISLFIYIFAKHKIIFYRFGSGAFSRGRHVNIAGSVRCLFVHHYCSTVIGLIINRTTRSSIQ